MPCCILNVSNRILNFKTKEQTQNILNHEDSTILIHGGVSILKRGCFLRSPSRPLLHGTNDQRPWIFPGNEKGISLWCGWSVFIITKEWNLQENSVIKTYKTYVCNILIITNKTTIIHL